MSRRVSNIDNINTSTDISKLFNHDDEEQKMIEQLVLGLRALSEVRNMCLRSKENFQIAERLQGKAERIHLEAQRHKQRYYLRGGNLALFQELLHLERASRCERSAKDRLQRAFKDLKLVYLMINKNDVMEWPPDMEFDQTILDDYTRTFAFLQERYHQSMKHVGAGRLPSFRGYMGGKKHNLYLGKTINDRQLNLLAIVIRQIQDDLKKSEMAATKRLFLRYAIPWAASHRILYRRDVLVKQ